MVLKSRKIVIGQAVSGQEIHLVEGGRQMALAFVFVHGIGVSERNFRPLMRRLAGDYRVLALDLPGFGVSPDPDEPMSITDLARTVLQVIEHEKIEKPIVVGHSMGCQVVTEAVRLQPDIASKIILIGPTIDKNHRTVRSQARRLIANVRHETFFTLALAARDYIRCGPRRYIHTVKPMMADKIEQRLPAMPVPVLVIRGVHDPVVPHAWSQTVANLALDGRLVEIDYAGHIVQHRQPVKVAEACREFAEYQASAFSSDDPKTYPLRESQSKLARFFPLSYGLFQTGLDWTYVWRRQAERLYQLDSLESYRHVTTDGPVKTPIIFIPGIYEPWQYMKPLIELLHARQYPVHIIEGLGYNVGDIPKMAELTRSYIEDHEIKDAVIIAHSKGGLIGKYLLVNCNQDGRVRHVIALNTPFGGSIYATIAPVKNVRSFSPADELIQALHVNRSVNSLITSIYSRADPSLPEGSRLDGAANIEINTIGHFRIINNADAHRAVLSVLALIDKTG